MNSPTAARKFDPDNMDLRDTHNFMMGLTGDITPLHEADYGPYTGLFWDSETEEMVNKGMMAGFFGNAAVELDSLRKAHELEPDGLFIRDWKNRAEGRAAAVGAR